METNKKIKEICFNIETLRVSECTLNQAANLVRNFDVSSLFNYVEINKMYEVREEENQVVFFSGETRELHFISNNAYKVLEVALLKNFNDIVKKFAEDDNDELTLKNFFESLRDKKIVAFH